MSDFSIGHRGATLQFPEDTLESMKAAAIQGAGIIECDVTFTKDRELICRHSQCDLHTTTNVVTIPELNAKCTKPWEPNQGEDPICCASDFTLEEIKMLCAKMDSGNMLNATTPEEYVQSVVAAGGAMSRSCTNYILTPLLLLSFVSFLFTGTRLVEPPPFEPTSTLRHLVPKSPLIRRVSN